MLPRFASIYFCELGASSLLVDYRAKSVSRFSRSTEARSRTYLSVNHGSQSRLLSLRTLRPRRFKKFFSLTKILNRRDRRGRPPSAQRKPLRGVQTHCSTMRFTPPTTGILNW